MKKVLGIDAGSTTVSIVLMDENKKVLETKYVFHKGLIKESLKKALREMNLSNLKAVGVTSSTPSVIKNTLSYDNQIAVIEAAKLFHKKIGSILIVGGEQFGLIKFNEFGEYIGYKSNTSCAAGTGSFLDQQAVRLNLKSSKELSDIAFRSDVRPPQIATRCSVFAKTDLIHAQQEGYKLAEISDGLCKGLAKNITDTLFTDEDILSPLIFVGGVSKNMAVYKHLKEQIGITPVLHDWSHLYEAIGAAVLVLDDGELKDEDFSIEWIEDYKEKIYGYDELELKLSDYPDFSSLEHIDFIPSNEKAVAVEVDLYLKPEKNIKTFLGIDIGSTSTKAVLINENKDVLAGFYTRTGGQPIIATQAIFEAIEDLTRRHDFNIEIMGVTTTGSGRKFIGKIIGADLMIDEITAHAKAAYELDNEVDTIIEIGGQDAKFTTLKNGMVTSSIMNNVCAAGTGSFIEEQAQKLGVPLSEYSARAQKAKAPVSSDRCTVYMERDINHYLSEGYNVDEVLASVLHSVRENYLAKVAVEANIGKKIFFQGATARNKALVAAFEQKLQKPILVSKYCHLTGALGGALIASESALKQTFFKGLDLYKEYIPIENEVCTICNNNCKIKKVTVQDEVVAFGFLCGRDYETKKFVAEKRNGFDLLKTYKKAMKFVSLKKNVDESLPKIGIPQTLTLNQEGKAWEYFFNKLGIPTVITKKTENPIKIGKKVTGAEFCAPISAFHGHVKSLEGKADFIFWPNYFETQESSLEKLRQYCYYTQFSAALIVNSKGISFDKDKMISPIIHKSDFKTKIELYQILKKYYKISYWALSSAYDEAFSILEEGKNELKKVFQREYENREDIDIVLLGRPYTILDENMNKGIPDIFAKNGLKTYFQEMIPYEKDELLEIEGLLRSFHWNYTSKILETAHIVSKMDGIYPVYISSFKCGPDSFALQYFKRIMDKAGKPYLILELDEHDSSVGYETRIEAAIRAFKNHNRNKFEKFVNERTLPVNPKIAKTFKGKKLLFPSWDDLSASLIVALLKSAGIDAEMVPVTEHAIKQGPRNNSGQCLPVNIMIESFIEYVEKNNLNPESCVAWVLDSVLACNIRLYPYLMKSSFEAYGNGFEKMDVYMGEISMTDISMQVALNLYFVFMFAGMLRKMANKVRPYEVNKGETDKILERSREIFYDAFLNKTNLDDALKIVVNKFKQIKTVKTNRPKVAILGDLYVRDNDIMNQYVIKAIEDAGGEAVTTPYNEYARMIAAPYIKRWVKLGFYKEAVSIKALTALVSQLEKKYYKRFNEILQEEKHIYSNNFKEVLSEYGVTLSHSGESFDNLIKIDTIVKNYPDISLFVLTNPAFCCAGAVTESMASKIEEITGVPVIALNYDGTGSNPNKKLIPYIKYAKSKIEEAAKEKNSYIVF